MALITSNCHEFGFFPDNPMSKYESDANQRKESTAAASGRGEYGEHDGQKTEANSTRQLTRNNKFKISHSALGYIGGMIPPTPTVMRVAVRVPSSLCTAGIKTPVPALSKERSADTFFTIGVPGGTNTFCCPLL